MVLVLGCVEWEETGVRASDAVMGGAEVAAAVVRGVPRDQALGLRLMALAQMAAAVHAMEAVVGMGAGDAGAEPVGGEPVGGNQAEELAAMADAGAWDGGWGG